jgi:aerobic-type carbon monoxide dehydrogenase small subunit (CoxS/CutS family)
MLTLHVNGTIHHIDVDPETPLLHVLNEQLGLIGTKYSCGIGECGACTVYLDGESALSCVTPVGDVEGMEITTVEGLKGATADAVRQAWIEEDVPQCGYCQPGQIMAATALLNSNPNPSDADIDETMSDILCRCGTYPAIRRAIHSAANKV